MSPCNCGGKKRIFEYVSPDGKVKEVSSQAEAIALVRKDGGSWRLKS